MHVSLLSCVGTSGAVSQGLCLCCSAWGPVGQLLRACVSVILRGDRRGSFSGPVFQVVDKSEYRTYAAQSLVQLLNKLPCAEYASFMAWLYGLTRNAKVGAAPV